MPRTKSFYISCFLLILFISMTGFSQTKRFDLNVRGIQVGEVLKMLAQKSGTALELGPEVTGTVNYSATEITLEQALSAITKKTGLAYTLDEHNLYVYKDASAGSLSPLRSPATAAAGGGGGGASGVDLIRLNFAQAKDVVPKITGLFGAELKVIADESMNSILIADGGNKISAIRDFVAQIDVMPRQVLIEAQIVETSDHFARDLGVSWGNATTSAGNSGSPLSGAIINRLPSDPNIALSYRLGSIGQEALSVKLAAAEGTGEAKVISRPKIVTADRTSAIIKSGITYYVKVLGHESAPGSSPSPTAGTSITGGLQQVSAGLSLEVRPTIVGHNMIQLSVDISNGETARGASVDGIPGVVNNSAQTLITIQEGVTATIAGLIKNDGHYSESGVPFLRNFPLFGWFFKSTSTNRVNNELVIFITPKILNMGEHGGSASDTSKAAHKTYPKALVFNDN